MPPGPEAPASAPPPGAQAEAAGYPPPPPGAPTAPSVAPTKNARDIALAAHLSALVGVIGVPSPIGPLIVWLWKRESEPFVDDQGKEALNFNLSAFLYAVGIFVVGFLFSFVTLGLGLVLFVPVFMAVFIAWVVLVIVGAVQASKGEPYRYPLTIRFVS